MEFLTKLEDKSLVFRYLLTNSIFHRFPCHVSDINQNQPKSRYARYYSLYKVNEYRQNISNGHFINVRRFTEHYNTTPLLYDTISYLLSGEITTVREIHDNLLP